MKEIKAPYIPIGWINLFFELSKRIRLGSIDGHLIEQNKICSIENASKVVTALKFLKIIDEKGKVIEENLKGIKLEGQAKKEQLKRIVTEAYSNLLGHIKISHAKREDIINYFVGTYGYSSGQSKSATRLFLYLANEAGIELSETLKKESQPSKKGRPIGSKNIEKRSIGIKKIKLDRPESKIKTTQKGEEDSININLTGKNVDLNLNLENLEDIQPSLDIISQILKLNLKKKRHEVDQKKDISYEKF